MDILVKVSGDLESDERFYDWLSSTISPSDELFILCGGGTTITQFLEEQGISFTFGAGGREIESEEGKRLAQRVLRERQNLVKRKLQERGIEATVFIPVAEIGDRICHINGDIYVMALYPNFDKIFVITLKERAKSFPGEFQKIKIVHL